MKTLILLLSLLTLNISYGFEMVVNPQLGLGFRGGSEGVNNGSVGYATAKVALFEHEVKDFNQLNFASLGLNYQSDGKWAASFSPISFSTLSGATVGIDYIHEEDDVKGGKIGVFFGVTIK